MQKIEYNILHFTRFSNTTAWSVNYSAFDKLSTHYPLVALSKVLKRIKEPVFIKDELTYKRITVRLYGQGVHQRDELLGKDIGTKRQFIAHAGQLIVSRIDARNGALGLISDELEGAIVTNDFWLFDVKGALPQFLMMVLSSERFQQHWQSQSRGTTNRQRVNEDDLLATKIPLPPLEIQQFLISKYRNAMNRVGRIEDKLSNIEKSVDNYLLSSLGVEIFEEDKFQANIISLYSFKSLARWDVWSQSSTIKLSKYGFVKFASIVTGKPLYGANEKTLNEKTDVRYIRITDINEDGSLGEETVSAAHVDEKYLLKENDFLIARSGNTVGKTFLYKKEFGRCIFAGYLIKFELQTDKIVPEYLLFYTKSSLFKTWIKNNQRIFGQPNINGKEYLNADIIVPEIQIQNKIVSHIKSERQRINELGKRSIFLRQQAKREFEEAIFSEA